MSAEHIINEAPDYSITIDGVVISHKFNKIRVVKPYYTKTNKKVVDLRIDGKYRHFHVDTLLYKYFPNLIKIPDGFVEVPGYPNCYCNREGVILYNTSFTGMSRGLKELAINKDNEGYCVVRFNYKTIKVHRLVALAFLPNPNNYPIINHKDENKANNNVDNLEWCDYHYNIMYGNGHLNRIKSNSKAILVIDNIGNKTYYDGIRKCSKSINVSEYVIRKCLNGSLSYKGYKFELWKIKL